MEICYYLSIPPSSLVVFPLFASMNAKRKPKSRRKLNKAVDLLCSEVITVKKIMILMAVISLFLYACAPLASPPSASPQSASPTPSDSSPAVDWKTFPLLDVRTGKTFTVSDFVGKPILVESFAVWCPVCTKQQQEIQKLHQELGEAFVSISLDTDPNEDAAKVLEAVQERGFAWRFAISPAELTKTLIDEFGPAVVNAPIAPIILVCDDQSTRFLGRGTKDVEELKTEIQRGC